MLIIVVIFHRSEVGLVSAGLGLEGCLHVQSRSRQDIHDRGVPTTPYTASGMLVTQSCGPELCYSIPQIIRWRKGSPPRVSGGTDSVTRMPDLRSGVPPRFFRSIVKPSAKALYTSELLDHCQI